jgi:hypothetical protein
MGSFQSSIGVLNFFKPVGNLVSKAPSAITSRSAGNFTKGFFNGLVGSRNTRRTVSTTTIYDGGLLGSRKTVTKRTGSSRPFSLSRLVGRVAGHEVRRSSQKPSLQNRILSKKNNVGNIELSNMSQESQQPQPQPQQPLLQQGGNKKKLSKKETIPPKKETKPSKKETNPPKKEKKFSKK